MLSVNLTARSRRSRAVRRGQSASGRGTVATVTLVERSGPVTDVPPQQPYDAPRPPEGPGTPPPPPTPPPYAPPSPPPPYGDQPPSARYAPPPSHGTATLRGAPSPAATPWNGP